MSSVSTRSPVQISTSRRQTNNSRGSSPITAVCEPENVLTKSELIVLLRKDFLTQKDFENVEKAIISMKPALNDRDENGETLLHHAMKHGKSEIVTLLTENNARLDIGDDAYHDETPLALTETCDSDTNEVIENTYKKTLNEAGKAIGCFFSEKDLSVDIKSVEALACYRQAVKFIIWKAKSILNKIDDEDCNINYAEARRIIEQNEKRIFDKAQAPLSKKV